MSVLYAGRFVVLSIRAKTLNPLFNWLDQFSSTHIPLHERPVMTGYVHFILKFTQKRRGINRERRREPARRRSTYIQIKPASVIVHQ